MRKSRLSQPVQNKLIELFVAGATAHTAAELAGVNKNTANLLLSPFTLAYLSSLRTLGNV